MRLQAAKSVAEREREKISDIMNRPALPSATITSFGGLKRERLLSTKLIKQDLGIVKRGATAATEGEGMVEKEICGLGAVDEASSESTKKKLTESACSASLSSSAIEVDQICKDNSIKTGQISLVSNDYFNSSSSSSDEDDGSKNLLFSKCT